VTRHTQLPHHQDIKRRTQRLRHLVGNRDAAPRQREHDHVVTTGVAAQQPRKEAARLNTIPKP
jgi:hypothetical protein